MQFAKDRAQIYSAGVETHGLNQRAVQIMREDGVDISHHTSNHVDEYSAVQFDFVITVCDHAQEKCPYFPGVTKQLHHNFSDPSKVSGNEAEIHAAFELTRNQIKKFCLDFVQENLS